MVKIQDRPAIVCVPGLLHFDFAVGPSVPHTGVGEGEQREAEDLKNVTVHFRSLAMTDSLSLCNASANLPL